MNDNIIDFFDLIEKKKQINIKIKENYNQFRNDYLLDRSINLETRFDFWNKCELGKRNIYITTFKLKILNEIINNIEFLRYETIYTSDLIYNILDYFNDDKELYFDYINKHNILTRSQKIDNILANNTNEFIYIIEKSEKGFKDFLMEAFIYEDVYSMIYDW